MEINLCPFCNDNVDLSKSVNTLQMTGLWNIYCLACNLNMREDFIVGKSETKARDKLIKRWSKGVKK